MSMTVGSDLQANLKNSKTLLRASSRFAEFGGTFALHTAAIFEVLPSSQHLPTKTQTEEKIRHRKKSEERKRCRACFPAAHPLRAGAAHQ